MLSDVDLRPERLIPPLFVCDGQDVAREIPSMPGQFQLSVDRAEQTVARWLDKGLRSVLLFGLPRRKDAAGSSAWDDAESVQRAVGRLKERFDDLVVITDVCLCEYTEHGHCGPLTETPGGVTVDNDAACELLGRVAVSHARAGADVVAPSAMMDGQVAAIRAALDAEGFPHTAILSYAVKFASSLYGPFRDAADSAPGQGDRKAYQMDYRAAGQAEMEAMLDEREGADLLMVKPAAAYLDVIARVRRASALPLAAYHVSGEYAMIKAAAQRGWLDEQAVATELSSAILRAGADLLITYYAEDLADWHRRAGTPKP